ncbi:MAG: diguanylate cyclase [Candidatus Izemoplasmatales bacterium]
MIKKLSESVYLITKTSIDKHINSISYLILDQEEAILIEPGSLKDFDEVFSDVQTIIPIKNIKYVIISHPDPDLTSSLPLFEEKGLDAKIVTEWRTKEILDFYNLKSSFYLIKENNYHLTLKSGRKISFIMTPFLHYSGSFVTYDNKAKVLFSGDLFGGMSKDNNLVAKEDYLDSMAVFHENYMPSSEFLRPIMKDFLSMDISLICPQHGKIIAKELIKKSIKFLYTLDFYNTPKQIYNVSAKAEEIDFISHLVQVSIRLKQLYSIELINHTFRESPITITWDPVDVHSQLSGYALWNRFFDIIYAQGGDSWLNALETLINRISLTYKIAKPQIYELRSRKLEEQNQEILEKYTNLESSIQKMNDEISKTKDQLMRCPVTGLYNKEMAKQYLLDHIDIENAYLINFDIDQMIEINREFSVKIGDDTMNTLKYIISNQLVKNELLFRGKGSSFILIKSKSNDQEVLKRAENLRNLVLKNDQFIKAVTISMGIINLSKEDFIQPMQKINDWFHDLEMKLELAKNKGQGSIVFKDIKKAVFYKNNILLVDEEQVNINLITHYFQDHSYRVYHARNPLEALSVIEKYHIDLIVSEINLSKLDGFSLKKSLN